RRAGAVLCISLPAQKLNWTLNAGSLIIAAAFASMLRSPLESPLEVNMRVAQRSVALAGGVILVTLAVAAGEVAPAFQLRIVRVGDTYQGLRFHSTTGEAWQIGGEQWRKVPEMDAPPAGEYDITVIPTDSGFIAVRFERVAGATWLLRNKQWV